jgi:hypothetical protein
MNTLHRGVPEHGAANLSALVMRQEDAIEFENPGKIGRDLGGREHRGLEPRATSLCPAEKVHGRHFL